VCVVSDPKLLPFFYDRVKMEHMEDINDQLFAKKVENELDESKRIKRAAKKIPVTKVILASLWQTREGTAKSFSSHKYSRIFGYGKNATTYRSSLSKMKKGGLVKKRGRSIFYLTPKGKKSALLAFVNAETQMHRQNRRKWDGGWRIVFFDIPEKKRRYRDYLRVILKSLGFHEFQRSVWISPWPAPSFLKDLLFEENIRQYTRFIITEHIEHDGDLKKKFNLV
jgi:DNA-binding transcriptional regulator PaaX